MENEIYFFNNFYGGSYFKLTFSGQGLIIFWNG